jgi:uncharacterized protein with NRDE domain
MCLIAFDWQPSDDKHRLALIANRDEFFERPTAPLHWWNEDFLAGKDLREGGTWMGLTRSGRFAALTNYRGPQEKQTGLQSRGHLVANFLRSPASLSDALHELERTQQAYNGFNLICGDIKSGELWWLSNRSENGKASRIAPGLHGLSNALLDTPWPKVARAKAALQTALAEAQTSEALTEKLLATLNDAQPARDEELPSTGVSLEWERSLSSVFIAPRADPASYGTRSSSVLLVTHDEVHWVEQTHAENGVESATQTFSLQPS